jgi:predicted dehydrogenase
VRTALIGLGRMGLRHLSVLEELELDVAGACDIMAGARAQAREAGIAAERLFDDPIRMLDTVKPECVVVATTAPSHCEFVCAAAQRGAKAILCEKPLAVSLAEADRMVEACAHSATRLAVNHQMRFMEQYALPKEIVTSEAFGGLSSVSVVAGNFGMAMNGSHYFEMFRYMTDEEPLRVAAWFSKGNVPNPRGAKFEDRAGCVRIENASGKRFYMDASTDQGHGMFVSYAGPHGRLDVDELAGHMRLVVREAPHRTQPTTRYGMPWTTTERTITPADAVAPTREVMKALLEGTEYPDGKVGRTVMEVLVAAYVSHEQGGRAVDLTANMLPRGRVFPWA